MLKIKLANGYTLNVLAKDITLKGKYLEYKENGYLKQVEIPLDQIEYLKKGGYGKD